MSDASALVSLAILKVDSDVEGRDYVDYLVPFISYVLDRYKPDPVSSQSVQTLLREEFKLRIPVHAAEMVLRRFAKRKYLLREHGMYKPVCPLPSTRIDILRKDARDRTLAVVNALREYVSANHGLDWSDTQAIEAITAYLSRFSVECLRCYAHGTALPDVQHTLQDQQLFLVNRFVIHARSNAPDLFEHLIVLVKGQMLSNALTCSDLESIPRKFGGVTFYLDTPVILQLFGLEGAPLEQAAIELLELVKNLKGAFAVFEHTAEEVYRVIEGAERHLDDPRAKGLIITEMRRAGKTASDLTLVRGRLQDLYKKYDIGRRNTPSYVARFQIDETVLHDALEEEITYGSVRAVDYDVNSIRSIYALRRGTGSIRLEDSRAVLVTSNSALARAAYDYGRDQESTKEVSAVITNFSLANLAWLKAPLGSPDLPQAEMIALCYAAMNPRENLWSAYIREIDKLEDIGDITARDHELLRYSLRARDELMNLTLGSEEAFSQRTVTQILDAVKSELVKEKDAEITRERTMRAEVTEKAARDAEVLARDQEIFRQSTRAELEVALRGQEEVRKRMYWLADRMGVSLGYVASCLLVLVLIAGSLLSGIYAKPLTSGNLWISIPAAAVLWLALIWGLLSWLLGLSVREVHSHIRSWLRSRVYRLLCRVFSVKPDSGSTPIPSLAS